MGDWSRSEMIALATLIVTLVVGGLGAIGAWLVVPEFRVLVRGLGRRAGAYGRWLASNWQVIAGSILLLAAVFVAYALVHVLWAVILIVGLAGASATLLLTRYHPTTYRAKPGWVAAGGPLMILSGEGVGYFSYGRDGPWTPAVACDPCFNGWPMMEAALWVWIDKKPTAAEAEQGQTVWHRLDIHLLRPTEELANATLKLMVDDWADVFVNDHPAKTSITGFDHPVDVDMAPHLRRGKNIILMKVENAAIPDSTPEQNPSGIVYSLRIV